jgi:hypothetical protein
MVGGSDLMNWLKKGAPTAYTPNPVPIEEAFEINPEKQFSWRPKRSAFSDILREIRRKWFRSVKVVQRCGRWIGKARAMRAQATEIRDYVPDPENMLSNYERNLRELLNTAKLHADRVLIVGSPWLEKKHYTSEEISHSWHGGIGDSFKGENVTVFYSLEVYSHLMRLLNLRAAQVADELDIEYVNLMPLLEPSLNSFYDHIHFAPAEAAVAAEAIAKRLLQPYAERKKGKG